MHFRFRCVCGTVLRSPPRGAGKTTTCPRCGQRVVIPDFELPQAAAAEGAAAEGAAGQSAVQEIHADDLIDHVPPERFARVRVPRLSAAAIIIGLATYGCLSSFLSLTLYFLFPGGSSLYLLCGLASIGAGFMTMENTRGQRMLGCVLVALLAFLGELAWGFVLVVHGLGEDFDWREYWQSYQRLLFTTEYRAVFLVIPCVPLGGLLRKGTALLSWRRSPLRPWLYQTLEGRQLLVYGPGRDAWWAAFWLLAAVAFVAMGVLTAFLQVEWNKIHPQFSDKSAVGKVIGSGVILALVCWRSFQRRRAASAMELLARDARPPIVLLRSFGDDGADGYRGFLDKLCHGVYALLSRTWEQRLARRIGKQGPFVAIGRPGEELPELGAARMYVSDADWQTVVKDLVRRSRGVVFQAGESAGLRWELHTVSRLLQPDQVIVFLPFPFDRNVERREERYARFQAWANRVFPGQLPGEIEEEFFLYWSVQPRWRGHFLERGDDVEDIPDSHRFKTTLQRLARDKSFRTPRLFGPFFYWSLALIGLALVVLALFFWLVAGAALR